MILSSWPKERLSFSFMQSNSDGSVIAAKCFRSLIATMLMLLIVSCLPAAEAVLCSNGPQSMSHHPERASLIVRRVYF